jgi:glycosyltransferase involved in cell wall biosynthesis
MRIMEIISGTAVNGAAVNCRDIARALAARGHELTVVCRPGAWIGDQFAGTSVDVVESSLKRWPADELRRIAGEVRERRVQLVHTHMSSANFFGVLLRRLFGIPACVATAHNRHLQLHWMFNDRVIAVSEATRAYHHRVNLVPNRRIDVVHNFIDTDRFTKEAGRRRDAVRQEFGIGEGQSWIGVIGDVIPRKGMLYLVRALPDIVRAVPDVRLLCAGHAQDAYASEVRAVAESEGVADRIDWAGPRSDIDAILHAIDVYVLPSLEESLPLSILEAMASGRPVVATSVGGIPECVVDGVTGRLVVPGKPEPLAAAIVDLLRNPTLRDAFGEAGRQRVTERFSTRSQVDRIEQIFSRMVA